MGRLKLAGRTVTERQISRSRKGQLLVPMIEERLRYPLNVDDQTDVNFIENLLMKQIEREEERRGNRRYSPSMLASCLRAVYFKKNGTVPVAKETRIEPNFYFLTGDWLHVKWQFVLFKMDREGTEGFKLVDCEVPVLSKRGDHGGTVDVVCEIEDELTAIDIKGLNVRAFTKAVMGDVDISYRVQIADYCMLWNSDLSSKGYKIKRGIILVENKGGPDPNHPIALTEVVIDPNDYKPEIRWRLEELRRHEKEETIPEPSCETVNGLQFQGCPFRKFCRKEVKQIQERKKAESRNADKPKVRRSERKRSARS